MSKFLQIFIPSANLLFMYFNYLLLSFTEYKINYDVDENIVETLLKLKFHCFIIVYELFLVTINIIGISIHLPL